MAHGFSNEEVIHSQEAYKFFKAAKEFCDKANEKLMVHLFGERIGPHSWVQFNHLNCDFLRFLDYLDSDNKTILCCKLFPKQDRFDINPIYAYCR